MKTRQAFIVVSLLAGLWACTPPNEQPQTPTAIPSTPTVTPTFTPLPVTPTPTSLNCLSQPGQVKEESLTSVTPAQEFLIYLPPCYEEQTEQEYPVLYLLHGQTFIDDQWVRLGMTAAADRLILAGEIAPLIMIFPDDRYWNLPPGPGFGQRLIELVIPYVDGNYRTLPSREYRALGGLSRGGGWTARLGFTHPELFGSLGLHSPAIRTEDDPYIEKWLAQIPAETRPRLWMDVGDRDQYLGYCRSFAGVLTRNDYLHEFHVYSGDHSESYWSRHTEEYLRWYVEDWTSQKEEP